MNDNVPEQQVFYKSWRFRALVLLVGGCVAAGWYLRPRTPEELLEDAADYVAAGDFQGALDSVAQLPDGHEALSRGSLIAAEAEAGLGRYDSALARFDSDSRFPASDAADTLFRCAQLAVEQHHVDAAEPLLRRALHLSPEHGDAGRLLITLFRMAGRNWEAQPFVLALLKQGHFDVNHLLVTGSDRRWLQQDDMDVIYKSLKKEQVLPLVAAARASMINLNFTMARNHLGKVISKAPDHVQAQAWLGEMLVQEGQPREFHRWFQSLPPDLARHPRLKFVLGLWAQKNEQIPEAARCFWEAVKVAPNDRNSNYQLSQVLIRMDRQEDALVFGERSANLAQLYDHMMSAQSSDRSQLRRIIDRLGQLGRLWEAVGWCQVALKTEPVSGPSNGWLQDRISEFRSRLRPQDPLTLEDSNPALKIDLSELALPIYDADLSPATSGQTDADVAQIAFADQALEREIDFRYFNGADPRLSRKYMFEFSGGGMAVVDCDSDGWPDIYLTQGCQWPVSEENKQRQNRIFRNEDGQRFCDVTELTGLGDHRFGQGASVGDFNNDGFPDVYIANIGHNRLCVNNGDGTFTDVSDEAGIGGDVWTISCAIADLNGDSHPELVDINYLGGADVYERACQTAEGQSLQCFPYQFPAEQDQLYLSSGDGRFEDATDVSGFVAADGKGMGAVVADFDGSRRLSIFVANDTTPNFLMMNHSNSPEAPPVFLERGLLSGVALSGSGRADSTMGVAIGDVDRNMRPDLFVTNFANEPNDLFVQVDDLFFSDRSRQSQLHGPGYSSEGWGAQFLDADLDGWQDLAVANGHLDNYFPRSFATLMRTQFFRNIAGRFREIDSGALGPYFYGATGLGRALARIDWNRDGKEDFGVTHVDLPFALLTNQTRNSGNWVAIRLRGVESARDAIGTRVTAIIGDQQICLQLTAGDGFSASNQRQLVFGLGKSTHADELLIQWPSGLDQRLGKLHHSVEYTIVEQMEQAIPTMRVR